MSTCLRFTVTQLGPEAIFKSFEMSLTLNREYSSDPRFWVCMHAVQISTNNAKLMNSARGHR